MYPPVKLFFGLQIIFLKHSTFIVTNIAYLFNKVYIIGTKSDKKGSL